MVTRKDIAEAAGVAPSTVSAVLNGQDRHLRISAQTRQRILDVIEEMGYRRNALAHAVRTGRSKVIAFITSFPLEQERWIFHGILTESNQCGYLVKVLYHAHEPTYRDVVRHCVEHQIAGVVIRRDRGEAGALVQEMDRAQIPCIFVDSYPNVPNTTTVVFDDRQGIRLMVEHLAILGHRRIAFLSGDQTVLSTSRRKLFVEAASEIGLDPALQIVREHSFDHVRTQRIVQEFLQQRETMPTAIFCEGDLYAAVVMNEMRSAGLQIPGDVSVAGYDDSSLAEPLGITTVAQSFQDIGRTAFTMLLDIIGDPTRKRPPTSADEPGDTVIKMLPVRLIPRATTGPPRQG